MINENFVILGAIFSVIGGGNYLISTIRGKTKPNRVTWFLWALTPLIAFVAEIKQGVGLPALMTFTVGFVPLLIFTASFFNKNSAWKIGKLDIGCGALSLLGLVFWYISQDANIAIFFSIVADGLAAIPTIVKSFYFPETENASAFLSGGANGAITLLTINTWNFAHYGFPLYILLICIILFVLIKFQLGKRFANPMV